ncbi:MAG: hypothetical protein GVY23_06185 [Spirochaetes bacterium]|jgi:hypothetical protein|nr:hypothetical protein [Spirochaetota bacterium]
MREHRLLVLLLLLAVALTVPLWGQSDGENEVRGDDAVRETTQARVELSTFRADVRPDFEIVLPTGAITQSIPLSFGRFGIDTTLGYAVNGNEINGEMVFSYDLGRVRPELRFFQRVDFEDYVDPRFSPTSVDVFADEEFVSRRRGVEPRVSVRVLPHTRVGTALGVTDTFQWSLSDEELVDEGIDLVPRVFLVYDNMTAVDPNRELEVSGVAGRLTVSERFRNSFENPVSLELQNRLLFQYLLGENWSIEEHLSFDTLIEIWRDELVKMYQLGGFDSVRGYSPNEIEAVRVGMLSSELSRRILRSLDTSFSPRERRRISIHQYRVFAFSDAAVTQGSLPIDSSVSYYGSVGVGIGAVVSRRRIHLDVSLAAAQPFELGRLPVVYLRTTLFNFERRL